MATFNPEPDLRTTLFGTEISMPILTAPCGGMRLIHPRGDVALARAAAANVGTMHVLSSAASFTIEEIAADPGPKWFQLYRFFRQEVMEELVERAQNAGYRALAITVDTTVAGNRERDRRNGYSHTVFQVSVRNALQMGPQLAAASRLVLPLRRDGMPTNLANVAPVSADGKPLSLHELARPAAGESHSPTWEDIVKIRQQWRGPMLLKGVLTAEDACRAKEVELTVSSSPTTAVASSTRPPPRWTRSPRSSPPSVTSLEVLVDGGVRRGVDVLKALAVGAKAVLVGRASVYGLAVGGQAGVERMLAILRKIS